MPEPKPSFDLTLKEFALRQDVLKNIGPIAAASLETVLLDGADHFPGICAGDEAFVRELAAIRQVKLPI